MNETADSEGIATSFNKLLNQHYKLILEKRYLEKQLKAMMNQLMVVQVEFMHLAKNQNTTNYRMPDPSLIQKNIDALLQKSKTENTQDNFDNIEEINTKPLFLDQNDELNQMVLENFISDESEEEDECDT